MEDTPTPLDQPICGASCTECTEELESSGEPLTVEYCSVSTVPYEYCEHLPTADQCRQQHPHIYDPALEAPETLSLSDVSAALPPPQEPKLLPGGKVRKQKPQIATISRVQRNRRKFTTSISGLELFGIKLPDAAKLFGRHFSCGSSVSRTASGEKEIVVQGDVLDAMIAFVRSHWQIPEESIVIGKH